jgi:hypothetical protein
MDARIKSAHDASNGHAAVRGTIFLVLCSLSA